MDQEKHKLVYLTLVERLMGNSGSICFKDESKLMKLISKIVWPFNRTFMTSYVTTIGSKVYYPSREYLRSDYHRAWRILAHELVHIYDAQRIPGFPLLYLFPATLLPFVLMFMLAYQAPYWAYLLSLVTLAPLPAPFRAWFELRGYAMTLAVDHWQEGKVLKFKKLWVSSKFTGSSYYFMWPFRKHVEKSLDEIIELIESNRILFGGDSEDHKEDAYRDVYRVLREVGAIPQRKEELNA